MFFYVKIVIIIVGVLYDKWIDALMNTQFVFELGRRSNSDHNFVLKKKEYLFYSAVSGVQIF